MVNGVMPDLAPDGHMAQSITARENRSLLYESIHDSAQRKLPAPPPLSASLLPCLRILHIHNVNTVMPRTHGSVGSGLTVFCSPDLSHHTTPSALSSPIALKPERLKIRGGLAFLISPSQAVPIAPDTSQES